MKNFKDLKGKFDSLSGAKYINVNGYVAKGSGEIANHNVNVNISVENAKVADLEMLKVFPASQLNEIATKVGASKEDALKAVEELIVSAEKNLSKDKEKRTAQSQGQTDAYASLGKGLKLHLETMEIHLFGFTNGKTIIKEGEYADKKAVKSAGKTLVKNAIKKTFRMAKSRNYILGHANNIVVTGDTIQL